MKDYLIVILVIALIISISLGGYFYKKYDHIKDIILETYYKEHKMFIDNNAYTEDKFIVEDHNNIFIDMDIVKRELLDSYEISNSGARVYIDIDDYNIQFETPTVTKYINENLSRINLPIKIIDNKEYMNLILLSKVQNFDYRYFKDENRLYINKENTFFGQSIGTASMENSLYGVTFEVSKLSNGEEVIILEDKEEKYLILNDTGQLGYVPKDKVLIKNVFNSEASVMNKVRDKKVKGKNVTFHQMHGYNKTKDLNQYDTIDSLDAIIPTWYSLNVQGIILNESSIKYVESAHAKGYKVWGLVDNHFDPDWTHEMLSDEKLRKKAISQILYYSSLYNLDGINIDFENVYLKDKDLLTQFVKELRTYTEEQNILLSMDVTRPGGSANWSLFYDRSNLSNYVDYMILMAYDEHWASSETSGSVASQKWVIESVEKSLEVIPREKLVLGIPFYTRVWKEKNNKAISSKAIGMKYMEDYLEGIDYDMTYDKLAGQNYISYKKDGYEYRIWVEDAQSVKMRMDIYNDFELPGIASWKYELESKEVWDIIEKSINKK